MKKSISLFKQPLPSAALTLAIIFTLSCSGDGGGVGNPAGSSKDACIRAELEIKANTLDDVASACSATRSEVLGQLPSTIGTCSKNDLDFDKPLRDIMEACNVTEIPVVSSSSSGTSSGGGNSSSGGSSSNGRSSSGGDSSSSSSSSVGGGSGSWCVNHYFEDCTNNAACLTSGTACYNGWYGTPTKSTELRNSCPSGYTQMTGCVDGSHFNQKITYDLITDSRDGKTYRTVVIGTQTWMAENLNYNVSNSKCGSGSSLSDDNTDNCDKYGRLYNWATAMTIASTYNSSRYTALDKHQGICPEGWHLPSDAEWTTLTNYVESQGGCTDCGGTRLKSTSGWNSSSNGTDNHGFSALPGGYGSSDGYFRNAGYGGYWWSSGEGSSSGAYRWVMGYDGEYALRSNNDKTDMFSVRCVQEERSSAHSEA